MSHSNLFDKNIERWAYLYPQDAVRLPYVDTEGYLLKNKVLYGPKGSYDVKNPASWFKKIKFNGEKRLVVYGVGLGEIFDPIEEWLKADKTRRVYFLKRIPRFSPIFFRLKSPQKCF